MANSIDPRFAASVIEQFGGRIVEHESLRFDLPLARVSDVVPRLNALNIGCRKILEWTETGPQGPHGVVRLVATNTPANEVRGQVQTNSTLSKFGF
jgi:hypothetical protein